MLDCDDMKGPGKITRSARPAKINSFAHARRLISVFSSCLPTLIFLRTFMAQTMKLNDRTNESVVHKSVTVTRSSAL